jgi:hypothetical protein
MDYMKKILTVLLMLASAALMSCDSSSSGGSTAGGTGNNGGNGGTDNTVTISIDGGTAVTFTMGPNSTGLPGVPMMSTVDYFIVGMETAGEYDDFDTAVNGFEVDIDSSITPGTYTTATDTTDTGVDFYYLQVNGISYDEPSVSTGGAAAPSKADAAAGLSVTIDSIGAAGEQIKGSMSGTLCDDSGAAHTVAVTFSAKIVEGIDTYGNTPGTKTAQAKKIRTRR